MFSRTSKPATLAVPDGGRQEAGEHAHRGGFAGAVRPQEADDLAFFYFERDVVDSDVAGVSLRQPFDFDHRFCWQQRATPPLSPHQNSAGIHILKTLPSECQIFALIGGRQRTHYRMTMHIRFAHLWLTLFYPKPRKGPHFPEFAVNW